MVLGKVPASFFCLWRFNFSRTSCFIEKKKICPLPQWMTLTSLSKIILPCIWGFISGIFVPLIYLSVFIPVPHYSDYCSFVRSFENRKCESSNFVILCQNCFGYARSLRFCIKFLNFLAMPCGMWDRSFFVRQELKPFPQQWKCRVLADGSPGKSQESI